MDTSIGKGPANVVSMPDLRKELDLVKRAVGETAHSVDVVHAMVRSVQTYHKASRLFNF